MFPLIKQHKESGVSAPADTLHRGEDYGGDYDMLESAASDLIHALHSKDPKAVCVALRAAFDMLQTQPQEDQTI